MQEKEREICCKKAQKLFAPSSIVVAAFVLRVARCALRLVRCALRIACSRCMVRVRAVWCVTYIVPYVVPCALCLAHCASRVHGAWCALRRTSCVVRYVLRLVPYIVPYIVRCALYLVSCVFALRVARCAPRPCFFISARPLSSIPCRLIEVPYSRILVYSLRSVSFRPFRRFLVNVSAPSRAVACFLSEHPVFRRFDFLLPMRPRQLVFSFFFAEVSLFSLPW